MSDCFVMYGSPEPIFTLQFTASYNLVQNVPSKGPNSFPKSSDLRSTSHFDK